MGERVLLVGRGLLVGCGQWENGFFWLGGDYRLDVANGKRGWCCWAGLTGGMWPMGERVGVAGRGFKRANERAG